MSDLTEHRLALTALQYENKICPICEEDLGTYGGESTDIPGYCIECVAD